VPKVKKNSAPACATSANVGYEAQLWQIADALRGSMNAAEYKHVCLSLLFLKYISDWGGERLQGDKRWQYGAPPSGNANFAWVQHIAHHLAPAGVAGYELANGSMSSNESGEGEYADIAGFCKSASLEEVRKNGHVLSPGRYVGAEAMADDGEPFEEKLLGSMLETFVLQELRRQASWRQAPLGFFDFRDRDDFEVDIVLEQGHSAVAGVEVKATATVGEADLRGLRKLRDAAGKRFAAGVVLYDGSATVNFRDGLFAVPIRALWEALT